METDTHMADKFVNRPTHTWTTFTRSYRLFEKPQYVFSKTFPGLESVVYKHHGCSSCSHDTMDPDTYLSCRTESSSLL